MTSESLGQQNPPIATRGSQERRRATPEDFLFGKLIGEGSFSSVFLAKEIKTGREVAIKVRVYNNFMKMSIHPRELFVPKITAFESS